MSVAGPLPAVRCPLCGGPNGCGPAETGSFAASCWCETVSFSRQLLDSIPTPSRGRACICRSCAEAADTVDGANRGLGRSASNWDGD